MQKQTITYFLAIIAFVAILVAGAFYADKVYQPPEAPPIVVNTLHGPVVLQDNNIEPGDLITAPDLGAIYYLNAEYKRVVFPDEQTFLSWYPDFDGVKHVSREMLESLHLSGTNATIRPGTLLITIASSNQVWVIGHPNKLYWMQSGEEQAEGLFGEDWAELVVDLPEYFFENYQEDVPFNTADAYPAGLLVHVLSNDQYYLVTERGQRQVTESGFTTNHLQKKFAIEREEPIDFAEFGPPLKEYEPKWGSPDLQEQYNDPGPDDIDVGDSVSEIG